MSPCQPPCPRPSGLVQVSKSISEAYDDLNGALQEAEEILVSLNIGTDFYVHLYDEGDGGIETDVYKHKEGLPNDGDEGHWLAFDRREGKWGLFYVTVQEGISPCNFHYERKVKHIKNCSKIERFEAAKGLPALLEEALKVANRERESVQEAAKIARQAIADFRNR